MVCMHSDFERIFNQASTLYNKGRFLDAIKELNELLSVSTLRTKEKLAVKFLKTLSLTQEKEYEEALKLADSIIEESQNNKFDLQTVDGLLAKAAIENDRREMNKSIKLIKDAEKILRKTTEGTKESVSIRQANLLKIKGWSLLYDNKVSKSLDCFETRIDISRKSADKFGIGEALNDTGIALNLLGEYEMALKFHKQALKIFQELDYRNHIGMTCKHIADIYQNMGETEKASEFERIYQSTRNKFKDN
ncbi:MAG: tetratricopeptide repeat protein [Candidatus Heimdallarchaeota archaeon]|nr:tetratricopeptide repeat protein [Candidatus Heimdallarchaeota archaeon]